MGQMMNQPLLISGIIEFAAKHYANPKSSRAGSKAMCIAIPTANASSAPSKMANALTSARRQMGDRVGTLAWNGYRHMELYYAVSGSGAVLHTINPRLHPEQLAYICNHAEDQYLLFDF
jgi:acyl-CoA synthetase (AMP-forming)/AMP-acid ligase II